MRIYLDISIQEDRFESLLKVSKSYNLFKKYNLKLVDNEKNSDLIIVLVNSTENLTNTNKNYIFETHKPIIILERCDSVNTWCRELDKIKNCIGVFKNRAFRDHQLNNSSNNIYGKISYSIIENLFDTQKFKIGNKDVGTEIVKKKKLKMIEGDKLKLIQTVLWDFHSSVLTRKIPVMVSLRENEINFRKEYDIFCVNQIKNNDYVDVPRKKCKDIVNSLSSKFKVVTRKLKHKEYIQSFSSSKICVACWGFGEWVHMDGYALYAGVILIKPRCDYVKMYPDIYQSHQRYIPCKADFSDLQEIIINVLDNYDSYQKMLIDNRRFLLQCNEKKTAKIFWKKVLETYKQHSSK